MKKDTKQRLFEVMSRLDKTFKFKFNELHGDNVVDNISESTDLDKYENVVFAQDEEANEPLEILNNKGKDAALEYLKQWHQPGSHMGSDSLDYGSDDYTYEKDGYIMSWNPHIGYIGLQFDLSNMNENIYKDDDKTSKAFRNLAKASDPKGYDKRWKKKRPGEVEPEKEKPQAMNQFKKDLNEIGYEELNSKSHTVDKKIREVFSEFNNKPVKMYYFDESLNRLTPIDTEMIVNQFSNVDTYKPEDEKYGTQGTMSNAISLHIKSPSGGQSVIIKPDIGRAWFEYDKIRLDKETVDLILRFVRKAGNYMRDFNENKFNAIANKLTKHTIDLTNTNKNNINENEINPKYTHFAMLKNSKKFVNGWDFSDVDPQDLKQDKKHYFLQDIIDMDINPKNVLIGTVKKFQKEGLYPFDSNNWYKFNADGWQERDDLKENKNIYWSKYGYETIDEPIISDAIKILSKNPNAIKFNNKQEFNDFKNKQKYFSPSYSHCYYSHDDLEASRRGEPEWRDGNTRISEANKGCVLLFETGRELVAVWDDMNKIGFVLPKNNE